MTKFALVAVLAIGVVKTLALRLGELRRHCLAISTAVQVFIFPTIATCICVHEFSAIFPHALSFEVAFCRIEEEKLCVVVMSGTLTFLM